MKSWTSRPPTASCSSAAPRAGMRLVHRGQHDLRGPFEEAARVLGEEAQRLARGGEIDGLEHRRSAAGEHEQPARCGAHVDERDLASGLELGRADGQGGEDAGEVRKPSAGEVRAERCGRGGGEDGHGVGGVDVPGEGLDPVLHVGEEGADARVGGSDGVEPRGEGGPRSAIDARLLPLLERTAREGEVATDPGVPVHGRKANAVGASLSFVLDGGARLDRQCRP
ncbi:MAG: hypothetical protein IPJ34_32345 [Myxococcales bacterium]|nr:hypothetical protein [Myxococcales bacterium]